MKKIARVILAALALAAPLAYAQQPASAPATAAVDQKTVAAVRDLLSAMKYSETMSQMMKQMTAQLPQMLMEQAAVSIRNSPDLTEEQRKEAMEKVQGMLPEIVSAARDVLEDPKVIEEMIDAMPALYARHFTYAEVIEMGKFYKTPLGAKTLKVMPQLMGEAMQIGQQVVAPRVEAMQQRLMKKLQSEQQGK